MGLQSSVSLLFSLNSKTSSLHHPVTPVPLRPRILHLPHRFQCAEFPFDCSGLLVCSCGYLGNLASGMSGYVIHDTLHGSVCGDIRVCFFQNRASNSANLPIFVMQNLFQFRQILFFFAQFRGRIASRISCGSKSEAWTRLFRIPFDSRAEGFPSPEGRHR